jgi:cell division protein FtsB
VEQRWHREQSVPEPPRRRPWPPERKKPAASNPRSKPKQPVRQVKPLGARREKVPDPARRRAVVRGALLSVLLVGVLFVFVYPTQTFLDQRDATNKAREQLDVLNTENAKLADAAKRLEGDDEIARIAREFYGLVKPGEQPFVILPAPTTTSAPPVPDAPGAAKPNP